MAERREATPWALLAQDQSPRTYAPGQLIYLQGTEADTFFYLLSFIMKHSFGHVIIFIAGLQETGGKIQIPFV